MHQLLTLEELTHRAEYQDSVGIPDWLDSQPGHEQIAQVITEMRKAQKAIDGCLYQLSMSIYHKGGGAT